LVYALSEGVIRLYGKKAKGSRKISEFVYLQDEEGERKK